jgi:hypothetical protein
VAAVTGRILALLPPARASALTAGPVTIDLDTTDVDACGRKKRGVAYHHQGQRAGRPHVATWAETETVLAADLGGGTDDPRTTAPALLRRALAALPAAARAGGRVALRAGAGHFAGALARAAHDEHIAFAVGAKRIAPPWRLLSGIAGGGWHDVIGMDGAQVAVADYCPDWWPATTRLLIRRVALDPGQVSADPRSRRRRTLHPDSARSRSPSWPEPRLSMPTRSSRRTWTSPRPARLPPARRGPRPPPGHPRPVLTTRPAGPDPATGIREPGATPGHSACPPTGNRHQGSLRRPSKISSARYSRIRVRGGDVGQ